MSSPSRTMQTKWRRSMCGQKKVLFSGTCFPSKLSAKLIFGRSLNFSKNLVLWNLILRNSSRHWKLSGCWFSTSFNRTCAPSPDWLLKIHYFNNDWSFGNFLYCWIAWRSLLYLVKIKKTPKRGRQYFSRFNASGSSRLLLVKDD